MGNAEETYLNSAASSQPSDSNSDRLDSDYDELVGALQSLTVDDEQVQHHFQCELCKVEFVVGDEVMLLKCRHYFHLVCYVCNADLWSCPACHPPVDNAF